MKILTRRAQAEDCNVLLELLEEVDVIHRENLPHIFHKPDGPVQEIKSYKELISNKDTAVFFAELDGVVAGFIHAIVKNAPDNPIFVPRCFVSVESIGVRPDYNRRGVGRRLLEAIEAWAKEKGAISIELNVYEFNQGAISFYERLGFNSHSRKMTKDLV